MFTNDKCVRFKRYFVRWHCNFFQTIIRNNDDDDDDGSRSNCTGRLYMTRTSCAWVDVQRKLKKKKLMLKITSNKKFIFFDFPHTTVSSIPSKSNRREFSTYFISSVYLAYTALSSPYILLGTRKELSTAYALRVLKKSAIFFFLNS